MKTQITGIPADAGIEVRLKSKQALRGARGPLSDSGFPLVDPGAGSRQIAFDDVASVKQLGKKSHTTRNVLIIVGVGLVAAVVAITVYAKKCPLGCH